MTRTIHIFNARTYTSGAAAATTTAGSGGLRACAMPLIDRVAAVLEPGAPSAASRVPVSTASDPSAAAPAPSPPSASRTAEDGRRILIDLARAMSPLSSSSNNSNGGLFFFRYLVVWTALLVSRGCVGNPDAKRLYDDLLSNYNRLIRPVSNNTDTVLVKLGLRLSQLIELVRVLTPIHNVLFFTSVQWIVPLWEGARFLSFQLFEWSATFKTYHFENRLLSNISSHRFSCRLQPVPLVIRVAIFVAIVRANTWKPYRKNVVGLRRNWTLESALWKKAKKYCVTMAPVSYIVLLVPRPHDYCTTRISRHTRPWKPKTWFGHARGSACQGSRVFASISSRTLRTLSLSSLPKVE